MELSQGEKLILALLCEIKEQSKLKGEYDPNLIMSAIYNGHLWSLEMEYSHLLNSTEDLPSDVRETIDILDMWAIVEDGYAALSDEEKSKVAIAQKIGNKAPKFNGFDGNNDPHFGIAQHFIQKMGRFQHFSNHPLNSHSQSSLLRYRKMFETFQDIRPKLDGRTLTSEELISILNP